MAHWGLAYAVGPNYNKAWEAFDAAGADRLGRERPRGERALASCAELPRRSSGR